MDKDINDPMAEDAFASMSDEEAFEHIAAEIVTEDKRNPLKWAIYDQMAKLPRIERVVKQIIACDEPGFIKRTAPHGRVEVVPTRMGRHFHYLRSLSDSYLRWHLPERHISLYAEVLFELLHSHWLGMSNPSAPLTADRLEADHFNELLDELRERCRSQRFLAALEALGDTVRSMYHGMISYIRYLIGSYRRLLVLRLDLYLPKSTTYTAEEAKAYLDRFLHNQSHNALFQHQVGYIWKMEWTINRSYHFHCFFFLNGQDTQNVDAMWAQRYGEYWRRLFPQQDGWFNNCNLECAEYDETTGFTPAKQQYRYKGIGKLFYYDQRKIRDLYDHTAYLAKREQALPTKPKGFRIWAHGCIPEDVLRKSGAQRKYE